MRRRLIEDLRRKGIRDERVLQAMQRLPRHFFLDPSFGDLAYEDKALPIDSEQTISQPYTVAYMTELLRVEKRQKVLEIGTGSGYQAAILALLGARVYTVERQQLLYQQAEKLFRELKILNIRTFHRDGHGGLPEYAPFERVLVTAGTEAVPKALKEQLSIGGIMVIPVGEKNQEMVQITRIDAETFEERAYGSFRFVPFRSGLERD